MLKKVIVCIDDEPMILNSLREQILRTVGHKYLVEIAENGPEAIELCAELNHEGKELALIICDHLLPGMLGSDILSHLHRLYPETLTILLTGQANLKEIIKAVNQANLYRFIAKPWNEMDLSLTIKEALNSYEKNQKINKQNNKLQEVNLRLRKEIQECNYTKQLLTISEARLESILNSLEDVVWSVSPTTLELLYLSPSVERLYGYPLERFLFNMNFWRYDMVVPEHRNIVENFFSQVLIHNSFTIEYKILLANEKIRWVKERGQVIYNQEKTPIRIDGTIYDITEQKSIEKTLTYKALHDPLTTLPNRAFFYKKVASALKKLHSDSYYQFAVLFVDLDGFKAVNDKLGHEGGDQLLIIIAQRLQKCVRNSDFVARFAGDEFMILLSEIQSINEVAEIAERILVAISSASTINNKVVYSGGSIGIVIGSPTYTNEDALLKDADKAMYQAKNSGKGRYIFFNQQYTIRKRIADY